MFENRSVVLLLLYLVADFFDLAVVHDNDATASMGKSPVPRQIDLLAAAASGGFLMGDAHFTSSLGNSP